jgi:hypothetical protein
MRPEPKAKAAPTRSVRRGDPSTNRWQVWRAGKSPGLMPDRRKTEWVHLNPRTTTSAAGLPSQNVDSKYSRVPDHTADLAGGGSIGMHPPAILTA